MQELFDIQADCQVWLDNLPPALADSTLAEHLREVCDLDLSMVDAVLPPEGFGRDRTRWQKSSPPPQTALPADDTSAQMQPCALCDGVGDTDETFGQ